jgi:hypothetical protein
MIAWTLFYHPVSIPSQAHLWFLVPLCAAVAVVYKAIRIRHVRRLAIESAVLLAYMVVGLVALGALMWVVVGIWH